MDLNSDGVINVEDVCEVAKLCSHDTCGRWDPAKNPGRATPTPLSFRGTPR